MLKKLNTLKPVTIRRDRLFDVCMRDGDFNKHLVYECVLNASVFLSTEDAEFIKQYFGEDPSIVTFTEVPLHIDDTVVKYFIHYVVEGHFTIHLGDEDLNVGPGDVFIMDPKKPHCVSTNEICITFCVEKDNEEWVKK